MSGFDGTWHLDLEESKVWNFELGVYEPDEVGQEIITIRTEGDVQDYEVLYGSDPVIRMGYNARFNDTEWTPYLVREIGVAPGSDSEAAVAAFRDRIKATSGTMQRNFEVGKPYGIVRMISGDERTHYRLARDPDSTDILYIMLRRLDEGGKRYTSYVFDRNGVVNRIRPFNRVD
ncbi:MAG: hypothetical protein JWQ64_1020 [Subtercola sp.]|jgi:hypothetical protein|nr:hypothetical protein [Subtercola sp.]